MSVTLIKLKNSNLPPHRKSHIGFMHKGLFYIHGGLDENDVNTDTLFCLNFVKQVWEPVTLNGDLEAFSEHKCAIVGLDSEKDSLRRMHSKHSVFDKTTIRAESHEVLSEKSGRRTPSASSKAPYMKKQGLKDISISKEFKVYMFGGRNRKGEGDNCLYCLKPDGRFGWRLSIVEAKGIGPIPRIEHAMSYIKGTKYIAIMGGSYISPENVTGTDLIGDFFLFDLFNLNWINVSLNENIIKRSNADLCEAEDGSLIIFGGTSTRNFIDGIAHKLIISSEGINLLPSIGHNA